MRLKIGSTDNELSSILWNDNDWHHTVITNDGTNSYVYNDGVLKNTITSSIWTTAGSLSMGIAQPTASFGFNGLIDEVGIWSRELNSTEVGELYNSGDGFAYPFVTDVTKIVSALTLSTTDEYPTLITTVPGGSLSLTASLIAPMPIVPLPLQNTVGTTLINKNYPNVEGLIAGTTKQTGNPNLVAIEGDRSW